MELTPVTQTPLFDMQSPYVTETVESDIENEPVGSLSEVETESSENQTTKAPKGVIRNLLNGHYKGVADLRLRINFADELSRITQSGQQASAVAEGAELVNTIGETFEALPDSGVAAEGLISDFETEVMAATEQLTDPESFELALKASFENLIDNLYAAYPSVAPEDEEIIEQTVTEVPAETAVTEEIFPDTGSTPVVETALEPPIDAVVQEQGSLEAVETTTDEALTEVLEEAIAQVQETMESPVPSDAEEIIETSETVLAQAQPSVETQETVAVESQTDFDLDAFVAELRSVFEMAMTDLMNTLSESDTLPPLSEPNGNGKAYAKFLAIYNAIQNGGDPLPTTDEAA